MSAILGEYADLTEGTISEYQIPEHWYVRHIGGRGITAQILIKKLCPKIEPFSDQNVMILAQAPFKALI